uniref:Uncharacterized protein n=1 Tax=Trichogramma kaykai TaxID=54128 RepID=A0ABD2VZ44_9HYME
MNDRREIPTNHEARRSYSSTNEIATHQHSAGLSENQTVTQEAVKSFSRRAFDSISCCFHDFRKIKLISVKIKLTN